MKPLSIELMNFRSHQNTIIPLSEIDTAVIVGKNGGGKSSIIYAMTYALWGVVTDVNLGSLVRKGAKEMSVSVSLLHDDGNTYRIMRGIKISGTKKKTPASFLSLFQLQPDCTLLDISANDMDATTIKISGLLGGLKYKTALYSNFHLQGESDKFMQASPAE